MHWDAVPRFCGWCFGGLVVFPHLFFCVLVRDLQGVTAGDLYTQITYLDYPLLPYFHVFWGDLTCIMYFDQTHFFFEAESRSAVHVGLGLTT